MVVVTLIEYLVANPLVLSALCTVLGGFLLKMSEKWLAKHGEVRDDRKEYREEIKELRERVDKLEESLADTRTKLFAKEEEVAELRNQLIQQGLRPNQPSQRTTRTEHIE